LDMFVCRDRRFLTEKRKLEKEKVELNLVTT
jgi:hypothetical protein